MWYVFVALIKKVQSNEISKSINTVKYFIDWQPISVFDKKIVFAKI